MSVRDEQGSIYRSDVDPNEVERLEWAVIEAAIRYRKVDCEYGTLGTGQPMGYARKISAAETALTTAVDALIQSREELK